MQTYSCKLILKEATWMPQSPKLHWKTWVILPTQAETLHRYYCKYNTDANSQHCSGGGRYIYYFHLCKLWFRLVGYIYRHRVYIVKQHLRYNLWRSLWCTLNTDRNSDNAAWVTRLQGHHGSTWNHSYTVFQKKHPLILLAISWGIVVRF